LWKSVKPNTVVLVSLKPLENDLRFKEHLRRRPSTVSVPPAVAEAEDKLDIVAGCYVRNSVEPPLVTKHLEQRNTLAKEQPAQRMRKGSQPVGMRCRGIPGRDKHHAHCSLVH
jgi:hypothetical protein